VKRIIDKLTSYLFLSAFISVAIHLAIIVSSGRIPIRGLPSSLDFESGNAPGRRLVVRQIDLAESPISAREFSPNDYENDELRDLAVEMRESSRESGIFNELDEYGLLDTARLSSEINKIFSESLKTQAIEPLERARGVSGTRPSLFAMDSRWREMSSLNVVPPVISESKRMVDDEPALPIFFRDSGDILNSVLRRGGRPSEADASELSMSGTGLPPESSQPVESQKEDDTSERSDLPRLISSTFPDSSKPDLKSEGETVVRDLDRFLNVEMRVFLEPEGGGYFRLDLKPNSESESLQNIPQNILFLIDVSKSIPKRKLQAFKEAVANALEYLGAEDRFNIVAFRGRSELLFDDFLLSTEHTRGKARSFLEQLESRGMTDLYGALAPFIDVPDTVRPLTVFILTDGVSTVRDKLENKEIIRHVGNAATDNISIFTASAGPQINRTLLDILSFANRGRPLHDEKLTDFVDILQDFLTVHSELLVIDLDYQVSAGVAAKDIYPRDLSHLARGQMLSLYGRVSPGTERIAIQLKGRNGAGEIEEFVYQADIKEYTQDDPSLRQDWIVRKALHLYVENIMEPSREIEEKLNALTRQYRIKLPEL